MHINTSCHARGTASCRYAWTVRKQLSNWADCCFPPSGNYISLFYFLLLLSPSGAVAEHAGVWDCGNEHLLSSEPHWQLFLGSVSPSRNGICYNSPLKRRWNICAMQGLKTPKNDSSRGTLHGQLLCQGEDPPQRPVAFSSASPAHQVQQQRWCSMFLMAPSSWTTSLCSPPRSHLLYSANYCCFKICSYFFEDL